MKEKAWIVVANRKKARIYRVVKVGVLEELDGLIHPEGRKTAGELEADKYGRGFERKGDTRHAYEPQTSAEEKMDLMFARIVANHLEEAANTRKFENLYIISEPKFLGVLKKELKPQVMNRVDKMFTKDLVDENPELIWDHVELVH